jgi:hypothetical protein
MTREELERSIAEQSLLWEADMTELGFEGVRARMWSAIMPVFARVLFEELGRGSDSEDLTKALGSLVAQMAIDVVDATTKSEHRADVLEGLLRIIQDSLAKDGRL